MLTLPISDCSPLNSNTCSAEHTPLSHQQQPRSSKRSLTPLIDPPAPGPGAPPTSLHLPIITIPVLIKASDFIGALAAGKQSCSVLDVWTCNFCLCCAAPCQRAMRCGGHQCKSVSDAVLPSADKHSSTCLLQADKASEQCYNQLVNTNHVLAQTLLHTFPSCLRHFHASSDLKSKS